MYVECVTAPVPIVSVNENNSLCGTNCCRLVITSLSPVAAAAIAKPMNVLAPIVVVAAPLDAVPVTGDPEAFQ